MPDQAGRRIRKMWKQGGGALDRTLLSLGEAAQHLADRWGLSFEEGKVKLARAFGEHTLPLSSLSHPPLVIHAVDVEDAEIHWEDSEIRRQPPPPGILNYLTTFAYEHAAYLAEHPTPQDGSDKLWTLERHRPR